MKLLLDACVWGGSKPVLVALGHDVVWAGDWPEDPGDDVILSRANAEERILVTLDRDFGELAVVQGRPYSGIIRLVEFPLPAPVGPFGIASGPDGNIWFTENVADKVARLRFGPDSRPCPRTVGFHGP